METLNTLAKTFADQVKNQLAQGLDESGNSPSINLFTYNQSSDAAATIAVNGHRTRPDCGGQRGGSRRGRNAVAVSQMATAPLVNGLTFTQSFAGLGTQVVRMSPRYARSERVIKIC
jgi:hypothetical protein